MANGATRPEIDLLIARARSLLPVTDLEAYFSPGPLPGKQWTITGPVSRSIDFTDLGVAISTRLLAGGAQGRMRVIASDGFHTSFSVSDPFPVTERPPAIAIQGVREGEPVPYGTRLALTASG